MYSPILLAHERLTRTTAIQALHAVVVLVLVYAHLPVAFMATHGLTWRLSSVPDLQLNHSGGVCSKGWENIRFMHWR